MGAGAGATTATVSRNTDTANALVVNLLSDDTTEATVVGSVTIAAGQTTSPAFDIDAVDDAIAVIVDVVCTIFDCSRIYGCIGIVAVTVIIRVARLLTGDDGIPHAKAIPIGIGKIGGALEEAEIATPGRIVAIAAEKSI